MDVQLQELIDKIKKDGVAAAETSASEKIAAAEKEAAKIIANAKEEADKIIRQAKDETARMEKASEDAIAQASRNLVLTFRKSVENELAAIVSAETEKAYDAKLLGTLIPETVKEWAKKSDASDLSVILNEKDLKALESNLKTALKDKISEGLTLKADNSIGGGFRIGVKDGAAFYDYSAEAVADLFSAYLNPRVAAIMKEAAK
ncbi:MAG: V-type ATP synthase subunit E [Treponema sp.]|jgi:V/A-type H+-transporting ATPase subunit E|nr:V-type ATP synthase subunit E [Treponema sp.]MBR4463155.1 V-type ATP synthase subunit E [Treponema sp.]